MGNFLLYINKEVIISYNPCTRSSFFDMFMPSGGKEETALIYKDKYYILNGDFRKQYEKCKNITEARKVFQKNIKKKSCWSN